MLTTVDAWLDKLNIKIRVKKDGTLRPILFCLKKIGLTANMLSTLKVIIACLAVYIAIDNVLVAAIVFLAVYFLDVFDGSMARYAGEDSDRGKFIDILTDQAIYTLVVFTLILIDFMDIKALAYNLLVAPVLYLLVVIQRNEGKPTDWIIKPIAKLTYYKVPVYAAALALIFEFIGREVANWVLYMINVFITLHLIYAYSKILKRSNKN
jgi:phosphatidylglycerophosphate synthase